MNVQQRPQGNPGASTRALRAQARRKYPRIEMQLPVKVSLPDGKVVIARTHNMTPEGLQIRCDRDTADVINPGRRSVPLEDRQQVVVMLRMQSPGEIHTCVLRCRLSYMTNTRGEEVAFGLEFSDPSPEQERALDTVFSHALRPA